MLGGLTRDLFLRLRADPAERLGWINRALPDAEVDKSANSPATRISGFESAAIKQAKSIIDKRRVQGPDRNLQASLDVFYDLFSRPAAGRLLEPLTSKGFQQKDDLETRLGYHLGALAEETAAAYEAALI